MKDIRRFTGALLGLAVGDAVGTTNEFSRCPPPIDDMVGGGPFNLKPGEWTDDTSMALCLADSLIACQGFNAKDQMERYLNWWQNGHNSVLGHCFDIGGTTAAALQRFSTNGEPYAGDSSPVTAGNGSLMRLAPVALFYWRSEETASNHAGESSRTTHAAPQAIDACRYFCALIIKALRGASKEEILASSGDSLHSTIAAIAAGCYRDKSIAEIRPTGYVVDSLEAALYCFVKTAGFEEGCLMAANLGGDSDTIAAIYGQLAGAYYGEDGIPEKWLNRLAWRDSITGRAEQLYVLSP
jgi:ADP-ribosyl-[dinitrogen reductase] hydrolase